ncbi:MAG: uroporphyrinogen decarboxylase family protein [Anaerolineales bacterium]
MQEAQNPLSQYERITAVLQGRQPDRHPFVTRLETWYKSHQRSQTLPERFAGRSLNEIHRALSVGQLKFMVPYGLKLRGVEVSASLNGETYYREWEPVFENFPGMWDIISTEKPGETITHLKTDFGALQLRHEILPEGVYTGTDPYLKEHLIKSDNDYRLVEHILERLEYVNQYDKIYAQQAELGEIAFVVPLLHRIPFQQTLLEYLGEIDLFYALHDAPHKVRRLLELLDQQMLEILNRLKEFDWLYVEFPDNLHSMMTNPRLFNEYCLPAYLRYTDILHNQGKKVGSHLDGDLKPLLGIIRETGLDVCESFSPKPLTSCTFQDAWEAWQDGPLIWGGIPSPLLEEGTREEEFQSRFQDLLDTVGDHAIIFGVVDLFMRHNSIDRVQYIANQLEKFSLTTGLRV